MVTTADPAVSAIYEQPLTERVRTLLRLELLYAEGAVAIAGDSEWHSRRAIENLVAILGVLSRGDLRSELIQELERLTTALQRLQDRSEIATERLHATLDRARGLTEELKASGGHPGRCLKNDELLASIIQRSNIAGGTCGFDLPGYQHWLLRPAAERQAQLRDWFGRFDLLQRSGDLLLTVLRESTLPQPRVAQGGNYQSTLERDIAYQLIRVVLPKGSPYYPEVSGSKLFFTVRFLTQPSTRERPAPATEDIDFAVACCA